MYTWPLRTKAEHRITLFLFLCTIRLLYRWFCKEAFNRVTAAGTGPFLKLTAFFAGRYLGRQQCGEVVLPERCIDLSGFEKTLYMPCRVFHAGNYEL